MDNMNFLENEYKKLEAAFLKVGKAENLDAFRVELTVQALHMWGQEPDWHDDYGQALAVIYDGKVLEEVMLRDMMEQIRDKEPATVMDCFRRMVMAEAGDYETFGPLAKSFVSDLITFLTDLSFVNGDCTIAEANAIEKIRTLYMNYYNGFMGSMRASRRGGTELSEKAERNCRTVSSACGRDFRDLSIFDLSDRLRGGLGLGTGVSVPVLQGDETDVGRDADQKAANLNLSVQETLQSTLTETLDLIDRMTKSGLGDFGGLGTFTGLEGSDEPGKKGGSVQLNVPGAGNTPETWETDGTKDFARESNVPEDGKTTGMAAEAEEMAEEKAGKKQDAPEKSLDELLAEMDALVGLDAVKKDIHSMINFIRVCKLREERGMKAPELSHHMVFSGNPGTGKTTIARMLSKLYHKIGVLEKGQLVEVDRSGLIAGYQGQTAIKTAEVIQSALGGVLFIDEAYSLVESDNDSYGKECIATVLKAMEDHRDELVVIVAGYDDLMHRFVESNPGLKSRFNKYIHFPDYTGKEMEQIFLLQCRSNGYMLEEAAQKLLRDVFDKMYEMRDENFGNGRTVRNTFEKIINCQASRLASDTDITDEELTMLTLADVKEGLGMTVEPVVEGSEKMQEEPCGEGLRDEKLCSEKACDEKPCSEELCGGENE